MAGETLTDGAASGIDATPAPAALHDLAPPPRRDVHTRLGRGREARLSKRCLAVQSRYGRLARLRPMVLARWALALGAASDRRTITPTPLGIDLYLDPLNNLGRTLASPACFAEERRALTNHLRPGGVFVDIGANEGALSVLAGTLVGPSGIVLAVEPQTRLQDFVRINAALNRLSNIRLVECALGAADGEATLHLYPDLNTGASGLVHGYRFSRAMERVRVRTAASLLDEQRIGHADLVKVDVEGFEPEVVRGLLPALGAGRIGVLMVDYHVPRLARRGISAEPTHRLILEAGMARRGDGPLRGYAVYQAV
jgi:FkbM family methyltransferase